MKKRQQRLTMIGGMIISLVAHGITYGRSLSTVKRSIKQKYLRKRLLVLLNKGSDRDARMDSLTVR